jgi:hypothetical protein
MVLIRYNGVSPSIKGASAYGYSIEVTIKRTIVSEIEEKPSALQKTLAADAGVCLRWLGEI